MSYTLHKKRGRLVGGLLVGCILFNFWGIVGGLTGVLGICATASETWSTIYFYLALLIPGCAFFEGPRFYQRYVQRDTLKE
jgi:hypothetical protein